MESGRKSHVVVTCVIIVGLISQCLAQKITDVVHFDHDSDTLKRSEKIILDSLCQSEATKNIVTLHLDGYCDSIGNYQYNLGLSERRAKSVLNYLSQKGITVSCTYFKGHSFTNPIADNSSEDGRHKNRRVHIEIEPTQQNYSGFLIGHVKNQSQDKLSANIHIIDLSDTNRKPIHILTTTGDYALPLSTKHEYLIISNAIGYFPDFKTINIVSKHEVTATLVPLVKNTTYKVPNMGFVPLQAALLPESMPTLEGLLQLMRSNPELRIRLEGHTNAVNSKHEPSWHIDLSQRRAQSIATYLVDNGVEKNRVSSKGFGSEFMIHSDPRSTRAKLKMNRRVEVRIL